DPVGHAPPADGRLDAATRGLLPADHLEAVVGDASAAVLLRQREADDARVGRSLPHRPVDDALLLPAVLVRHDLLVEEGRDRLPEILVVLVVELSLHSLTPVLVSACLTGPPGSEQLEDRRVGLAAALAHGLQAVPDALVLHVV